MIIRAWTLFQGDGNKSRVAKRLRTEFPDDCPHPETVERWLRAGEESEAEAQHAVTGLPAALTVDEGHSIVAQVARDAGGKGAERLGAVRLAWEQQGKLAPREVRIRATYEILQGQPLAILDAAEAELIEEFRRLEGNATDDANLLPINDLGGGGDAP